MSTLIKIGNQELAPKEFRGQRVVTFKDIDLVHERPDGTAKRNFSENRSRFIEGEDYFAISAGDVGTDFVLTYGFANKASKGYLLTEQGYLMLVKSFTDELAWKVQRDLVNTYFKVKKILTAIEQLQLTQQAILEVKTELDAVNDDLQSFKLDMPCLGVDLDRIKNARNRKIVPMLGGRNSNAYNDSRLRGKVYKDNAKQIWREFGVGSFKQIKRSQVDSVIQMIDKI